MPGLVRPASSPCETEKTWLPPLWRQGLAGRRRLLVVLARNYATAQGFAQSCRRAGCTATFRGCRPAPQAPLRSPPRQGRQISERSGRATVLSLRAVAQINANDIAVGQRRLGCTAGDDAAGIEHHNLAAQRADGV